MSKKILKFIFSIVICEVAGAFGAIFTTPAIQGWYTTLQKPSINPPNWIFAPVWTFLFFLMGVSLYLIIKNGFVNREIKKGLIIFGIQFVLNILWSYFFFYLHKPLYAFIEIITLWLAIMAMILQFMKLDKRAAYLQIPYLLWVSFASVLNYFIWRINM